MKAFPTILENNSSYGGRGMDLRDYFAAKALLGMLSTKDWFSTNGRWASEEDMFQKYAKEAYKFADAMMEVKNESD
jgi:hypothetical protein